MPRLQDLFTALPGIELSVATSSAFADIRGGDANVAIRFGAGGYDGVASERLLGDAVTVLVPAGEPVALLHETTLLVDDGTTAGEPWMRWPAWLAEAGVDDGPKLRRAHFGTAALCVQASAASAGACVGRMSLAHELLRQGILTALLPWRSTEYSYYLITRHGDADNPRVQAFRRWLREEIDRFCEVVQRAHGVTLGTPAVGGTQAMP